MKSMQATAEPPRVKNANDPAPPPTQSLLDTIRSIRELVGDGLGDEEFTCFIRKQNLPADNRFTFLCFHEGWVTFAVPAQGETSWHPTGGRICGEKEKIGAELAKKYGLHFAEPPDASLLIPAPGAAEPHHHLRLYDDKQTLVVAHPAFLKVRLYAGGKKHFSLPLALAPDLLKDLSALYKTDKNA
jgi:hypothetical protein